MNVGNALCDVPFFYGRSKPLPYNYHISSHLKKDVKT